MVRLLLFTWAARPHRGEQERELNERLACNHPSHVERRYHRSERQPQLYVHLARRYCAESSWNSRCDPTHGSGRTDVRCRECKVGMVEHVRSIEPQLCAEPFKEAEVFRQSEVRIRDVVSAENSYSGIPKPADIFRSRTHGVVVRASWYLECCRVEPVVDGAVGRFGTHSGDYVGPSSDRVRVRRIKTSE
jgi:hypothetical protein